jgi:hypothetical protein
MGEGRRIAGLTHGHEESSGAVGSGKFGLASSSVKTRIEERLPRRDSAGNALQGGFRAAELVDQRAEGGGSDILAADQAEPASALTIAVLDRGTGGRCFAAWVRSSSRQCVPPRLASGVQYCRRGAKREAQ